MEHDVQSDPIYERACDLVSVAEFAAMRMAEFEAIKIDFREKFYREKSFDDVWWDFVVAIAIVFVGIDSLSGLELTRGHRLREAIIKSFDKWIFEPPADAVQTLANCEEFYKTAHKDVFAFNPESQRSFVVADVLGSWMVWKMIDQCPKSDEELRLARTLAEFIINGFSNWLIVEKEPS